MGKKKEVVTIQFQSNTLEGPPSAAAAAAATTLSLLLRLAHKHTHTHSTRDQMMMGAHREEEE